MATSLTSEQQQQLGVAYQELKEKILEIDHKYSLSYNEVVMDFPESLGLEKIEYTPHTQSQLQEIAENELEAKYTEKRRNLNKSYVSQCQTVQNSIGVQQEKHRQKLAELATTYQKDSNNLTRKLIKNGLWYSQFKTDALAKALADYNGKVQEQTTHYNAQLETLNDKQNSFDDAYDENVSSLDAQMSADIARLVTELAEKEAKYAVNIEKYNMSVDEKEAKYRASCIKSLQYAVQAEYDRALTAARLFAELGESGVDQQKKSEKLSCCKVFFTPYRRAEAQYMMSLDNFLQANLLEYYSTLQDWVDTILLP